MTDLLRGRAGVLLAIVVFSLALRAAVTSLTPLLGRIADELAFGSATIGLLGMLPTLMFGIAGLAGPALGRRFGLEQVTLAAVIVTVVGTGLRGLADGPVALVLTSALALLGMGIGNILIPPLVKRYFSDRIALVSTMYMVALQLGTAVPAAVAVPLADTAGWRVSLAVWAVVPLAALPFWGLAVARRASGSARRASGSARRASGSARRASGSARRASGSARRASDAARTDEAPPPRLPVWRSRGAWGLALLFGMASLVTYSVFTWAPAVITDAGGSESLGGLAVAVFPAANLLTTFIAPALCTRFRNPFGFVAGFACCTLAGLAGLRWAPLDGTVLWALLLGVGATNFPMALTLINVRTRTSAGSSSLSGFGQGIGYLLACTGPLLFGVLHERSSGWDLPFGLLAAACAVMVAGGWFICRPHHLEDVLAGRPGSPA